MPETPAELQAAQERLYEDESLRGNLTDDQATPLLDWAATQLEAAPALEKAQDQVRSVLRLVNQAAAKEGEAREQALSKLDDLVQDLPGAAPPPLPPDFMPARRQLKVPLANLNSLSARVPAPESAPATEPAAQLPAPEPAPTPVAEAQPAPEPQPEPTSTTEAQPTPTHAPEPKPAIRLGCGILAPDRRAPAGIAAPPTPQATPIAPQPRSPRVRSRRRVRWGYSRANKNKS